MQVIRKNTPNQYALDGEVKALVLHTTLGAFDGAVTWLMKSPAQRLRETGKKSYSSANVVFGRKGQITELAPPNRGTWHAGRTSRPSERAKAALPKHVWGRLKNPNKHTLGLEFAAGYDVDRDGVLESWEKLYTVAEIKAVAWYILNEIEPAIGKEFGAHNIITHQDIASYKPDLDKQREMVLAELAKQRQQAIGIPRVAIKVEGSPAVYITHGDIAVPCKMTWADFQAQFPNTQIKELSKEDFNSAYTKATKAKVVV